MSISNRIWLFWLILIIVLFAFIFAVKAILLPFIIGILVAYFLDPAADRLERWGYSRLSATLVICLLFFGLIIAALVVLIPTLVYQLDGLIAALPDYIQQYRGLIDQKLEHIMALIGSEQISSAKEAVSNSSGNIAATVGNLTKRVLSSGFAIVNLASLIIITPIVSFYLLRDWDRITAQIDSLLPRDYADTIREQVAIIDRTISGYVRGMVNVMLILGVFYAIGLSIVGLHFAILIGLLGGIAIIVPYIGTIVSGAAAVGMAYVQFDTLPPVLIVLGIFTAGQMLEGYILTPKLVGDKIGLHPLWLIFGMLCGAALFGFVGIFIAIPVTAVIGVLVRFAVSQYRHSSYFKSSRTKDPA